MWVNTVRVKMTDEVSEMRHVDSVRWVKKQQRAHDLYKYFGWIREHNIHGDYKLCGAIT